MKEITARVAWLSPARVVRCWVNSKNERNPYLKNKTIIVNLKIPLTNSKQKKRTTPSPHGLYRLGYTRVTMNFTKRNNSEKRRQPLKKFLVQIVTL